MPSARYTREIPQRYRLEGAKCAACGDVSYPPRQVCRACGATEFQGVVLPPRGKVVTYTVIRVGPSDFAAEVPYALAIIELEDGTRLMTQLVDVALDKIKAGMPVELEFRKLSAEGDAGIICYGHKAVPA